MPNFIGRFARWTDKCVWRQTQDFFADDPDMEFVLIDGATARAASLGGGSPPKMGGAAAPSPRKKRRRVQRTKTHAAFEDSEALAAVYGWEISEEDRRYAESDGAAVFISAPER